MDSHPIGRMTEEINRSAGPDWPEELREPIARLGTPAATFRTTGSHVTSRMLGGIGMILVGLVANYLYWFVFAGPPIPEHFLILVLFGVPLSGMALVYAAWRDRGLWVIVYPMGLLRWQRGKVVSLPWNEVEKLYFVRVMRCNHLLGYVDASGERGSAWLPWEQTGSRLLGAYLKVVREDGVETTFPTSLTDFPQFNQLLQEEIFRVQWPRLWARFIEGEEIEFGAWSLSLEGLRNGEAVLPWANFQLASVEVGKVMVRSAGKWRPWAEMLLHQMPNPHLFLALVEKGPPRPNLEPTDAPLPTADR